MYITYGSDQADRARIDYVAHSLALWEARGWEFSTMNIVQGWSGTKLGDAIITWMIGDQRVGIRIKDIRENVNPLLLSAGIIPPRRYDLRQNGKYWQGVGPLPYGEEDVTVERRHLEAAKKIAGEYAPRWAMWHPR